jgi:hypothetical protein
MARRLTSSGTVDVLLDPSPVRDPYLLYDSTETHESRTADRRMEAAHDALHQGPGSRGKKPRTMCDNLSVQTTAGGRGNDEISHILDQSPWTRTGQAFWAASPRASHASSKKQQTNDSGA